MNGETALWLTASLFTLTYLALAFGRVPGLRIDRAGIALVGATLMLVPGRSPSTRPSAPTAIDYKTLALLFGMMVVVGFLRLSGLLRAVDAARLRKNPQPPMPLGVDHRDRRHPFRLPHQRRRVPRA